MCVAFNSNAQNHELGLFGLEGEWDVGLIRPTDIAPIIIRDGSAFSVRNLAWGYRSLDRNQRAPQVNARAETLFELRTFRDDAFASRCLIPVRAFYEWQDTGEKKKRPWRFERTDGTLLWVAGIWKPSEKLFCMVTSEPSRFVREVHDRMPAILEDEVAQDWLDPSLTKDDLERLLIPGEPPLKMQEENPLKPEKPQGSLF